MYVSNPSILETPPKANGALLPGTRHSEPLLDEIAPPLPPPLLLRRSLDRRISNSMDALPTLSKVGNEQSSESIDVLNAEPYLQPMEVQMVMHTLPRSHKIPESTSYHSLMGDAQSTGRKQQPVRMSAIEISESSMQDSLGRFGHRRTASNPWVLDGSQECPLPTNFPQCPVTTLPPPVPRREFHCASRSPPQLSSSALDPQESSLDFPHDSRRSVVSASLSPNLTEDTSQPHYADIDEMDNVSTVSGPFEEISDDPDSSNDTVEKSREAKSDKSKGATNAAKSPANVVKRKSSGLNSDYEKIEEYVTMAPSAPLTRRSMIVPDTPNPSERAQKKTAATPLKAKKPKGWSRQNTDSVIPDAATVRSSSPPLFPTCRSTVLDSYGSPRRTLSSARPLPPSPSKSTSTSSPAKRVASRNSSSGSNIYETIDEELLNRVYPRRRGSGLPKWAPPVEPKHYAQYMVILRKFFTDPHIISAWERTVKEIIPGGDIATYLPPYSNAAASNKATKKLGPSVEVPQPRGGSADSTPRLVHQISHVRESSNDQYILPVLNPHAGKPQSSSTPATPALQRGRDGGTPPQAGGSVALARAQFASRRPPSREDLIEMLNMSAFNQGDSSESESSESDEETEGEREEGGEEGESEEGEGVEVRGSGEEGEGEKGEGVEKEGGVKGEDEESGEGKGEEMTEDVERNYGEDRGHDKREGVNDGAASSSHVTTDEDFDDVITDLNPAFDSVAEPDSIPNDTAGSHAHIPTDSAHQDRDSTLPTDSAHQQPDSADSTHQDRDSVLLRASVSTDSDLDSGPLLKPSSLFTKRPRTSSSGGSRIMKWVSTFERGKSVESPKSRERGSVEKGSVPPVPMRKPGRRREGTAAATDGMSDSGISNCHSQTFDDTFNLADTN